MKLSILIVNWNTREFLIECVNSIFRFAPTSEFEIIVVDNNSADESASALDHAFGRDPRLKIIEAGENLGFARGSNLAYKSSSGEYILLLNPDTEGQAGSLAKLIHYFDTHPEVQIVGGKIVNPDGSIQPSVRKFPDLWSSFLVFTGLYRLISPRKYLMEDFDYETEQGADQVMGAVLLTRRATIERLGFLDEKFWLWYEEVDFCYRVKKSGGAVMYYPEARFVHHGGQSFSQVSVLKRKMILARSLFHYFKKRWREKL